MAAISSRKVSGRDSVRIPPAPAGRMRQDLAGLDDRELLAMVSSLPRASDRRPAACELAA